MKNKSNYKSRLYFVIFVLVLLTFGILWRMFYLGVFDRRFLLKQSNARTIRTIKIPAYRGMIMDRYGQPLAVSTPVDSVWINPKMFDPTPKQITKLARLLKIKVSTIKNKRANLKRSFVYLERHLPPGISKGIKSLGISGIFFQREYRRYYPEAEISAHVVGLTNIDDNGQEGIELAYDKWLRGRPGKKQVVKDRMGHIVANVDVLRRAQQGHDLILSLDSRIQYLAFQGLKEGVNDFHAKSGSVVVLDIKTGEILAMVNWPSYNSNHRPKVHDGRYRNRAVTDIFEPGSTMKPFSVMSALESKKYNENTLINTNPGWMNIGGNIIRDHGSLRGVFSVKQVLKKSSNIGVAKIAMSLPPDDLWDMLHRFGFGERTGSAFPGEAKGSLIKPRRWRPINVATLSFGYGVSVTALQLARAYAVLGSEGLLRPVSFVKLNEPLPAKRVVDAKLARQMLRMLESVVEKDGTGSRAGVAGYHVAGKTGTAYIASHGGYTENRRYMAAFVGIAPLTDPRLVVAVVVMEPQGRRHFGGQVAAPVFSRIMAGSLRLLGVKPDNV